MSERERVSFWYVEPLNKEANEYVSKNLEDLSDEMFCHQILCSDGKPHDLIRCPNYQFIDILQKKRKDWQMLFQLWYQHNSGKIYPLNFIGGKTVVAPLRASEMEWKNKPAHLEPVLA
jgi:hypothetical protein